VSPAVTRLAGAGTAPDPIRRDPPSSSGPQSGRDRLAVRSRCDPAHPRWAAAWSVIPRRMKRPRAPRGRSDMSFISAQSIRRRHFLKTGAACGFAALSRHAFGAGRPPRPGPAAISTVGDEFPATEVWTYNVVEPGPGRASDRAHRSRRQSRTKSTTVHWDGIRLPSPNY